MPPHLLKDILNLRAGQPRELGLTADERKAGYRRSRVQLVGVLPASLMGEMDRGLRRVLDFVSEAGQHGALERLPPLHRTQFGQHLEQVAANVRDEL